ncbi:MAG: glycosyltransferase family 2 protein [Methylocystaceae bacterium]|nr:glycosyltransferase family 2 protein [Methylocystaceae bacterium]
MTETPHISIILPTYNRANMLVEAIESVRAQTFSNFELIIVDNGSADDTCQRVDQIKDERIVFITIKHANVSAARNIAVAKAKGKYIAFLDDDDLWLPKKLEKFYDLFQKYPETIFAYSSWYYRDGQKDIFLEATAEGDIRHYLLLFGRIGTPSVMLPRTRFIQIGAFDETMTIGEDTDLWCRLSTLGEIRAIKDPLTIVRKHSGNTIIPPDLFAKNRLKTIQKIFQLYNISDLKSQNYYEAQVYFEASLLHKQWGNLFTARKKAFTAIWKAPINSPLSKRDWLRKVVEVVLGIPLTNWILQKRSDLNQRE